MLTKKQKDFAAEAIDIGGSTDRYAVRIANFIRINYGESISLARAERIWKRYEKRKDKKK